MAILMLLTLLIPLVFGEDYQPSVCDCYTVNLQYGYPKVTGNQVCYRYLIEKKDYSCSMSLDYYILGAGQCGDCNIEYSDLGALITSLSIPEYIQVPYNGYTDGTNVNGIQINNDNDQVFEICFDKNQVAGTQPQGTIGLKPTDGNGAACIVKNTLPDFCGGVTPEPTNKPTAKPTTSAPTGSPTDRPTTAELTPRPTEEPTTSEPTASPTCARNVEDPIFSCECFDNDPNPDENCPRSECTFNTGEDGNPNDDGFGSCNPIEPGQPGGPGPDPNDGEQPVECDLDAPIDACVTGDVCVDGQAVQGGDRCIPMTGSMGTRFGCCKSPPIAVDDDPNEMAFEGIPSVINPLPNDSDPDNDPFTIDTVGTPSNGGSVTNDLYTVIYTPSSDKCDEIAPTAIYVDTIPYTIKDADGLTSTAIITVTVACARRAP